VAVVKPDLDRQPRQPVGRWPFPGDNALVRARKVAQMYRAALGLASPDMQRQCDDTAAGFGELWVAPRQVVYDDDDWLRPADAADFLCVSRSGLNMLRTRGRITGRWDEQAGMWRYRVADLRVAQGRRTRRKVDVVAGAPR
jgi:hypothetical protein